RTRLRPVNVCAMSLLIVFAGGPFGPLTGDQPPPRGGAFAAGAVTVGMIPDFGDDLELSYAAKRSAFRLSASRPKNDQTALGASPGRRWRLKALGEESRTRLLKLSLGAGLLQLGLDLLGLFLGDAFFDGLRRAFDEILGLLQAERGDGAHFLDDLDLLVAD